MKRGLKDRGADSQEREAPASRTQATGARIVDDLSPADAFDLVASQIREMRNTTALMIEDGAQRLAEIAAWRERIDRMNALNREELDRLTTGTPM
jgi:hypothetical protein